MQLGNYYPLFDIDVLLNSHSDDSAQLAAFIISKGLNCIKQRSSLWFEARKTVYVTGSTLFASTGTESLKAQQQHFDEAVRGKDKPEVSEETQRAMDWGVENEINAVATLCSKFLPAFLPHCVFYEVGSFKVDLGSTTLLVSPDGMIYDTEAGTILAVVEIKCPYSGKIHDTIPTRYYLQVQAEMAALGVQTCFFVSYTTSSTTVFEVSEDQDVWNLASEELNMTYGDSPQRPSRSSEYSKKLRTKIKENKTSHIKLITEVKSVKASPGSPSDDTVLTIDVDNMTTHIPPHRSLEQQSDYVVTVADVKKLRGILDKVPAHLENLYGLSRRKASEVIAFLASDTDRLWGKDAVCGSVVNYFLKGYSLPVEVVRNIMEDTLNKCKREGMHVPVTVFDGQTIQILQRGVEGTPQTRLQLQKDVWATAVSMQKSALVETISEIGKVKSLEDMRCYWVQDVAIDTSGQCNMENPRLVAKKVEGSTYPHTYVHLLKSTQSTLVSVEETVDQPVMDSLEDDLLVAVQDQINDGNHSVDPLIVDNVIQDITNVFTAEDRNPCQTDIEMETDCIQSQPNTQTIQDRNEERARYTLTPEDICNLKAALANVVPRWATVEVTSVQNAFCSAENLCKLTVVELKAAIKYVRERLETSIPLSGNKEQLVRRLQEYVSIKGVPKLPTRLRSPSSLAIMCKKFLKGKGYPKAALNASYADFVFPRRLTEWKEKSFVKHNLVIPGLGPMDWFYIPEYSKARDQLEVRKIDYTHTLTAHRRAICKRNIGIAKREHFLKVAESGKTNLKVSMIEDSLNMQSTDFALVTFSEAVQTEMEKMGFPDSAAVCKMVREWFEANDAPGLGALERCRRKLRYKEYLMGLASLNTFPPPGMFVAGYPKTLWESTIAGIDSDIYLYSLTRRRTYSSRAASSQPCEGLFSSLAAMPGSRNGCPTAAQLESDMAKLTGEAIVRQDPARGFSLRLSKAPVYPQMVLEKDVGPLPEPQPPPTYIRAIAVKDHLFDSEKRKRRKPAEPKGISALHSTARGVQGVRQYHKVDEGKLNPLSRMGLSASFEINV
ncbi:uncharacterized protein LOC118417915 [Branchiostoma floridae]|uniref:Uncharacterized protein LOC118417915 n=1 Tax=Branchiostoma floridae TaxID=7739 RepID=A0A9J7LB61_BRAFL|nr:uncharacterized protein LOC118417915 [Branchiostoma floridae]